MTDNSVPSPKHSRVPWLLLAAAAVLIALACGYGLKAWEEVPATPAPLVVVTRTVETTREVTREVTLPAPTPRTVVVYQPTVVEIPVTRVVYVNTYYTPTPPMEGRG